MSLRLLFEAQYVAKVDRRVVFDQPDEAAPRVGVAASRFLQPLPDFFPINALIFGAPNRSLLGARVQVIGNVAEIDPADPRQNPGQIEFHQVRRDAHRFEQSRSAITVDGANAHLGHHPTEHSIEPP